MVDDVIFPDDIAYGSTGGPEFSTTIVVTRTGFEQRNQNWLDSRCKFNVSHGVKTHAQLLALTTFFRARKGRARGFLFRDHRDYQATGELLGAGDGSRHTFQLIKTYSSGGVDDVRAITRPDAETVVVKVNGVVAEGWTLADRGVVTFAAAPASGAIVSASFEFFVPCRFDTDSMSATLEGVIGSWEGISIVELREC